MREGKSRISRFVVSDRVLPKQKPSPKERIANYIEQQTKVANYPFSANLSVKTLGSGNTIGSAKKPSDDNKEKEKKKLNFRRIGVAVYDPKATKKPGQTFHIYPRKYNRDGRLGDVANAGWLDPIPTMNPLDFPKKIDEMLRYKNSQKVQVAHKILDKDKRTGNVKYKNAQDGIEEKALGRSIRETSGNLARLAARAVGIVFDAAGRMRCPPGVPAANQFTDDVGSNCFDFTPAVGRALMRINSALGAQNITDGQTLRSVMPNLAYDDSGNLVDYGARSSSAVPGARPTPLSPEDLGVEDLSTLRSMGVILPENYETEFRKAIIKAFPDMPEDEVQRLTKAFVERARIQDTVNAQKMQALNFAERELGISIDYNDPESVRNGMVEALKEMRRRGMVGFDIDKYFVETDNDARNLGFDDHEIGTHQARMDYGAAAVTVSKLMQGHFGLTDKKLREIMLLTGETDINEATKALSLAIAEGLTNFKSIDEILSLAPDDPRYEQTALLRKLLGTTEGKLIFAYAQRGQNRIREYEAGYLISLVNLGLNDPDTAKRLQAVRMRDWQQGEHQRLLRNGQVDVFDGEFHVVMNPRTGRMETQMILNPVHLFETMHDEPVYRDKFTLFEGRGAATEIERMERVSATVGTESSKRESESILASINKFDDLNKTAKRGEAYQQHVVQEAVGTSARAQFVFHHESMHGKQHAIASQFLEGLASTGGLATMSPDEQSKLAIDMVLGRRKLLLDGREIGYADLVTNPNLLITALDNLPQILNDLYNSGVGGTYSKSDMLQAVVMNDILSQSTEAGLLARIAHWKAELSSGRYNDTHRHDIQKAVNKLEDLYARASYSTLDEVWQKGAIALEQQASRALIEMQAEIGAGVAVGLIDPTPEITAFLAPIGFDGKKFGDTSDIGRPATLPTKYPEKGIRRQRAIQKAQAEIIKDDLRNLWRRKRGKPRRNVRETFGADAPGGPDAVSDHDVELAEELLEGTVPLKGRRDVTRWAKGVRDAVMRVATPRQKKAAKSQWRRAPWNSGDPDDLQTALIFTPEKLVQSIDDQLVPFTELVDSSVIPEDVVVEVVLPDFPLDELGEGTRQTIAIDGHFTAVIKSDEDFTPFHALLSPETTGSGSTGQRIVFVVEEGMKGLPDDTPGTSGGEVGTMILPPGEIEILERFDNGLIYARIKRQRSAEEHLSTVRQSLDSIDKQVQRPLRERIAARRAKDKIDRPTVDETPDIDETATESTLDFGEEFGVVRIDDGGARSTSRPKPPKTDEDATAIAQRQADQIANNESNWLKRVKDRIARNDEKARTRPRPLVQPRTIEEAIQYVMQGYDVDMPDREGAHVLVDRLALIILEVSDMADKGLISKDQLKKFVFDMCQITVAGTSAFCDENQGIPRYMMPQAEGEPRRLENGEYDTTTPAYKALMKMREEKRNELRAKGVSEEEIEKQVAKITEVNAKDAFIIFMQDELGADAVGPVVQKDATKLKASQRDMQGEKVVGMYNSAKANKIQKEMREAGASEEEIQKAIAPFLAPGAKPFDPGAGAVFVSRDGYIIDGHHRVAAQATMEVAAGQTGEHMMNVRVVDANVVRVLEIADKFVDEYGIERKKVAASDKDVETIQSVLDVVMPRVKEKESVLEAKRIKDTEERLRAAGKSEEEIAKALDELDVDKQLTRIAQEKWDEYTARILSGSPQPVRRERVTVTTMEEAVEALLAGKEVDVPSPEFGSTIISEWGEMVDTLKKAVDEGLISKEELDQFVFDLCQITVKGASPFCMGNSGIPRYMMPQAIGEPVPGSKAAIKLEKLNNAFARVDASSPDLEKAIEAELRKEFPSMTDREMADTVRELAMLKRDGKSRVVEVNMNQEFREWLIERGYRIKEPGRVKSHQLRATQRDMQGHKVTGMLRAQAKHKKTGGKKGWDPSENPIFTTSDNFVVDGHHRWAATLGNEWADGTLDDNSHTMNVEEIQAPLSSVLPEAIAFTDDVGIKKKTVAETPNNPEVQKKIMDVLRAKREKRILSQEPTGARSSSSSRAGSVTPNFQLLQEDMDNALIDVHNGTAVELLDSPVILNERDYKKIESAIERLEQLGENGKRKAAKLRKDLDRRKKRDDREWNNVLSSVAEREFTPYRDQTLRFSDALDSPELRNSLLGARSSSSGARSSSGGDPKEKPQYPRKPTYGPLLGKANEIFEGVKTWEEFKKRYEDTEVTYIDYETTGLKFDEWNFSNGNGNVVQIGGVKMKGGKVVSRFSTFVNPGMKRSDWETWSQKTLKDGAGNLLSDEFLADKPSIADAHAKFVAWAGPNAMMGVQNAAFDKDVLEDALRESNIDWTPDGWIDLKDVAAMSLPRWSEENPDGPFKFDKKKKKNVPSNSLADITKYLGVKLDESEHHDASNDAEATAKSLATLIDKAIEKQWSTNLFDGKKRDEYVAASQAKFDKDIKEFDDAKAKWMQKESNQGADGGARSQSGTKRRKTLVGLTPESNKEIEKTRQLIASGELDNEATMRSRIALENSRLSTLEMQRESLVNQSKKMPLPDRQRQILDRLDEINQEIAMSQTRLDLFEKHLDNSRRGGTAGSSRGGARSSSNARFPDNPPDERTVEQKIIEGPKDLSFGRDEMGLPKVASVEEAKKKFGTSRRQIHDYFYGKYGIPIAVPGNMLGRRGNKNPDIQAAGYGALQALDDMLSNLGGDTGTTWNLREILANNDFSIRLVGEQGARMNPLDFLSRDPLGSFGPRPRFFRTQKFGRGKKQRTRIDINMHSIAERGNRVVDEQYLQFGQRRPTQQVGGTVKPFRGFSTGAMWAASTMPEQPLPDPERPDGLSEVAPWKTRSRDTISESVRQQLTQETIGKIAYATMIHEFAHLLDFSQRDLDNQEFVVPSFLRMLFETYKGGWSGKTSTEIAERIRGLMGNAESSSTFESASRAAEIADLPAVTQYGATIPVEGVAEAFTAWFLFAQAKDIGIPSWRLEQVTGVDGKPVLAPKADQFGTSLHRPVDIYAEVVKPLLEKLGNRVKSLSGANNYVSPLVIMFALAGSNKEKQVQNSAKISRRRTRKINRLSGAESAKS